MSADSPEVVESGCGAVAVGSAYLFSPLSSGGASIAEPLLRFHTPLIEPDVQISRIRLSDKTSRLHLRKGSSISTTALSSHTRPVRTRYDPARSRSVART